MTAYTLSIGRSKAGPVNLLRVREAMPYGVTATVAEVTDPDEIAAAIRRAREIGACDPFDNQLPDDADIITAIMGDN